MEIENEGRQEDETEQELDELMESVSGKRAWSEMNANWEEVKMDNVKQ